jgi:hypothetical protein
MAPASVATLDRAIIQVVGLLPRVLWQSEVLADSPTSGHEQALSGQLVFAVTVLLAASCTDYLMGVVDILRARNTVYSSYALARAATEAAAIGCYLTDKDIDALERLRRTANFRLNGLCEQISMVEVFRSDEAASKVAHNKTRIEAFGDSGHRQELHFQRAKGPGRPARLGDAQPSAMRLMGLAVDKDSPDLGATYQRLLSSVTHSGLHGLTKFLSNWSGLGNVV